MSIQEFERLSTGIARGDIDLPDLLKDAVRRNRDPQTSAILFEHFMDPHIADRGSSSLLKDARIASQRRLAHAFGVREGEFTVEDDAIPTSNARKNS